MSGKMTGNEYRTTIVCIDSYKESEPRGRICNVALDGGEAFESLMQFLLLLYIWSMARQPAVPYSILLPKLLE